MDEEAAEKVAAEIVRLFYRVMREPASSRDL